MSSRDRGDEPEAGERWDERAHRPVRDDELVIVGVIARLNDKGLQLEGEGGKWRNFGALKVTERLVVGATVELVARDRWINAIRVTVPADPPPAPAPPTAPQEREPF